jgi:hypothetical protein
MMTFITKYIVAYIICVTGAELPAIDQPKEHLKIIRDKAQRAVAVTVRDSTIRQELIERVAAIPELEAVEFIDCKLIPELNWQPFRRLKNLKRLHFISVNLKDAPRIQDVGEISLLSLRRCKNVDKLMSHVAQCRSLNTLDLGGSDISDAGLALLRGMPLEELALSNAELTKRSLEVLLSMRKLERLYCHGVAWTDQDIEQLRRAHPASIDVQR